MAAVADTQYSEVPQADATKPLAADDEKGADAKDAAGAEKEGVISLKPKMTLLNGITVIVGSIIGSGIFVSPKGVLQNTGSVGASLIVWVICGLFSLIGAYCYAELGCMITKTGADYAYIMVSFGPFVAFLRLWVECMIVRPCSQAIVALTFSFYVLRPIYPDCPPPDEAVRMLACLCIGESLHLPRSPGSTFFRFARLVHHLIAAACRDTLSPSSLHLISHP